MAPARAQCSCLKSVYTSETMDRRMDGLRTLVTNTPTTPTAHLSPLDRSSPLPANSVAQNRLPRKTDGRKEWVRLPKRAPNGFHRPLNFCLFSSSCTAGGSGAVLRNASSTAIAMVI